MNAAGLLLSIAVHAATFFVLGRFRLDDAHGPADVVEVSLVEETLPAEPIAPPEPVPEAPEPEPEPVVLKPPPKLVERAPKPPKEPPVPSKAPLAAAEETVADFSGTTLTGQGGWASAVGNGAAMDGPIGAPNAVVTGRNRAGVAGGVVDGRGEGLRVVPEGELSRRVKPPGADVLNAALERAYPKAARQQGVEGVARIRLRVMPTGKLQPLNTLNETFAGFGDACKASLRGIEFEPALDRTGKPCATDIPYTCRFTVQ